MTLAATLSSAANAANPVVPQPPITHWLFDNDGVNIDSESAAMRVMDTEGLRLIEKFVPEHGLETDHIYSTYPGTSTDKIVEALITQFSLPIEQITADYALDLDAIKAAFKAKNENSPPLTDLQAVCIGVADDITLKTIEHFKVHLTAIPGAAAALTEMRATYGGDNVALCTTSREDRMDVSLDYATEPGSDGKWNAGLGNLYPKGPLRISGYDVTNKYDLGFKLLEERGFVPATTGVVEDSKSGVSKAVAGRPDVRVIGTVAAVFYKDKGKQAAELLNAGAKLVISDMHDLPKAAAWLNTGLDPHRAPEFAAMVYLPPDNDNGLGYSRTPSYAATAPAPPAAR